MRHENRSPAFSVSRGALGSGPGGSWQALFMATGAAGTERADGGRGPLRTAPGRGIGDLQAPGAALWRERVLALRLEGLEKEAPRPARSPSLPAQPGRAVREAPRHPPPPPATPWSVRSMAKAQGISRMAVQRICQPYHLKLPLIRSGKLSRDNYLVEKLSDVGGLALNPPDRSLVWGVAKKSPRQALDRPQPGRALTKGRGKTLRHDYKRHGTTTLFAARSRRDGQGSGECMPRHRPQEFIGCRQKLAADTPRPRSTCISSWTTMSPTSSPACNPGSGGLRAAICTSSRLRVLG
jgi:hypothetical protein